MKLLRELRAVTTVEFALVSPMFILMMLGIIEGSRAVWTYQAVQEVASHTARHVATSGGTCETVRQFAVDRAARSNIILQSNDIAVTSAVTCHNVSGMIKVQVRKPFLTSVGKLLPGLNADLLASSCFPKGEAAFAACASDEAENAAAGDGASGQGHGHGHAGEDDDHGDHGHEDGDDNHDDDHDGHDDHDDH